MHAKQASAIMIAAIIAVVLLVGVIAYAQRSAESAERAENAARGTTQSVKAPAQQQETDGDGDRG
jgi:flagellar basal body-associated protein FliL